MRIILDSTQEEKSQLAAPRGYLFTLYMYIVFHMAIIFQTKIHNYSKWSPALSP